MSENSLANNTDYTNYVSPLMKKKTEQQRNYQVNRQFPRERTGFFKLRKKHFTLMFFLLFQSGKRPIISFNVQILVLVEMSLGELLDRNGVISMVCPKTAWQITQTIVNFAPSL